MTKTPGRSVATAAAIVAACSVAAIVNESPLLLSRADAQEKGRETADASTDKSSSEQLSAQLGKLRAVDVDGQGHRDAAEAWRELSRTPAARLPDILAGMKDANPLAMNWIRAAVETIAQRQRETGGELPTDGLERFLADTGNEPRARRVAYELIASVDPTAQKRLIPGFLNDPSLELRRDAVAMKLEQAQDALQREQGEAAIREFREALSAARAVDQINLAAEELEKLDVQVDLPTHFGFVMQWYLIGPFDNRDASGFDVAYPPESEIDLAAQYDGQAGKVKWTRHSTADKYGILDLNKALGNHKGAIAYALAEFETSEERDVELRLGCTNGNKIWLNGQLLTANHVYHAGMFIDQYVGKSRLKKGKNQILLKIAQNEQTEPWAQDWHFQLRVCDRYGTAVLSQDRPVARTALSETAVRQ